MSCARCSASCAQAHEPLRLGHDEVELDAAAAPRGGRGRRSSMPAWRSRCWRSASCYALDAAALAGQRAPALLLQLLAAAAVVLRGPRPLVALPLAVVAYGGEALLVDGDPGSPATIGALLLTTYSAAARADRRGGIAAACLALGAPAAIALAIAGADAADVLLPVAIFAIPWLAGRAVAAYRRQGEELRVLAQRLARERDARARLAVLDERARVARELHDSVAHAISVMVLQAGAAEQVLDTDARAGASLDAGDPGGRPRRARSPRHPARAAPDADDEPPPLAPRPGLADLERLLAASGRRGLPVRLEDDRRARSRCRPRSTEPRTASSRKR